MLCRIESNWIELLHSTDVNKYLEHMEVISRELLELLMEGLGLPPTCLNQHFSRTPNNSSFYRWNHYPTCQRPDLAIGIGAHTDPWVLTILSQDDVGGLQVLKDRKWMGIRPLPGALVVNIGDTLQVILPPHSISDNHLMMPKHDWWFFMGSECSKTFEVSSKVCECYLLCYSWSPTSTREINATKLVLHFSKSIIKHQQQPDWNLPWFS